MWGESVGKSFITHWKKILFAHTHTERESNTVLENVSYKHLSSQCEVESTYLESTHTALWRECDKDESLALQRLKDMFLVPHSQERIHTQHNNRCFCYENGIFMKMCLGQILENCMPVVPRVEFATLTHKR